VTKLSFELNIQNKSKNQLICIDAKNNGKIKPLKRIKYSINNL
jgi:hypothetical protein